MIKSLMLNQEKELTKKNPMPCTDSIITINNTGEEDLDSEKNTTKNTTKDTE